MSETPDLKRALGRVAWRVWEDLQIEASSDGVVTAKRSELASCVGVSPSSIDRALARLEAAGLVRSHGQFRHAGRWKIYGEKEDQIEATAWAVNTPIAALGGAREGSGRRQVRHSDPPGSSRKDDEPGMTNLENQDDEPGKSPNNQNDEPKSDEPGNQDDEPSRRVNNQGDEPGHLTSDSERVNAVTPNNQDDERDASSRSLRSLTPFTHINPSGLYSFGNARADARVVLCNSLPGKKPGPGEGGYVTPWGVVLKSEAERKRLRDKFGPIALTDMNTRLGIQRQSDLAPTRRHGTPQELANAGLIPGFPGKHVLPMNWFPRAPRLPEAEDGEADADLLWRAFQSVARFRGSRAFAGGWNRRDRAASNRGAPLERLTSLPEAALRLAAGAMRDQDVEPAAWVWWSWDVWERGMAARGGRLRKGSPPPLRWMFAEQRIHEKAGWFRSETNKFRIFRNAPWPRPVRDLWERYQNLLNTVRGMHAEDDQRRVRAEVRKAFPDGYERHLKRAQEALKAQAEEIREAVVSGTFLW